MKRFITAVAGIVLVWFLVPVAASAANETPTYNQDVGPILYSNCSNCHRPNQIAPMSLLSYKDARPWARAIKSKVEAREMPPWFADPRFGEFANDTSLSDEDIATITAWVDAGAPEGDGPSPTAPTFSAAGWSHPDGSEPDFIYEAPFEWHIDAEGESPNFNLYSKMPFDDARMVAATQLRPGNYAATHHIVTGALNVPPGLVIGTGPAWPGGPVTDYTMVPDPNADPALLKRIAAATAAGGAGPQDPTADLPSEAGARAARSAGAEEPLAQEQVQNLRGGLGPYIPGVGAEVAKSGQAREIRGDLFSHLFWNLHYQATGKPETARPVAGLWWAKDKATTRVRTLGLNEHTSESTQLVAPPPLAPAEAAAAALAAAQAGQGLNPLLGVIPANAANWTVTGIGAFQNDAIIQSLFIHAHVRGKDFTWVLTYPDGREEVLLRVPNYNFDWQFTYDLAEPLKVPAGSTVKSIARYDNSRENRRNPAPHKDAYWSEQSWDDMFLSTVSYTVDETATEGDE